MKYPNPLLCVVVLLAFFQCLETQAHIDFQSSEKTFDVVTQNLKADQSNVFKLDMELHKKKKAELSEAEWKVVFNEASK